MVDATGWDRVDPVVSIPLAKTGDSDAKVILSEMTLESRNEKASGGVFDLTTA